MKKKQKQPDLKEALLQRIRSGIYEPDTALPTGLALSRELGTSYVTMTRVLKGLEKDGFVTAVRGKGTFVRAIPRCDTPGRRVVNLVVWAVAHPTIDEVIRLGKEIFSAAGWQVRVLRVVNALSEIKEKILADDAYTLIFAINNLSETFGPMLDFIHKRLLLLGNKAGDSPVVCITADEQHSIRLCMEHFHANGLRRIALIRARRNNELEMERAAVWRSITFASGGDTNLLWDMDMTPQKQVPSVIPPLLESLLRKGELSTVQGIITPDVEVAMLVAGFLMDHGIRVPEDVQLIAILDNPMAQVFRPQISCIDSNLEGHIRTALSVLEERIAGHEDKVRYHLCQPRLILRGSTRNQNHAGFSAQSGMAWSPGRAAESGAEKQRACSPHL